MAKLKRIKLSAAIGLVGAITLLALSACQGLQIVEPVSEFTDADPRLRKNEVVASHASDHFSHETEAIKNDCIPDADRPRFDKDGNPLLVELNANSYTEIRLFFNRDNAALNEAYLREVDRGAEFTVRCSNRNMVVLGSTSEPKKQADKPIKLDSVSSNLTLVNLSLAGVRAQNVKDYAISRGVPPSRIRTFDCGANYPIAPNDTEEGASMNQRVFAWVAPIGQGDSRIDPSSDQYQPNCKEFSVEEVGTD